MKMSDMAGEPLLSQDETNKVSILIGLDADDLDSKQGYLLSLKKDIILQKTVFC